MGYVRATRFRSDTVSGCAPRSAGVGGVTSLLSLHLSGRIETLDLRE